MIVRLLISVCLLGTAAFPLAAQTLDKNAIEAEYKGKVVLLRGRYLGDKLSFNSQGDLQGKAQIGPLDISAIHVETIKWLRGKSVEFDGQRATLVRIGTETGPSHLQAVDVAKEVKVAVGIDAANQYTLQRAINMVFASSLNSTLTGESPQQQENAIDAFPLLIATSITAPAAVKPQPVGGKAQQPRRDVIAPRLLYSVEPEYTDAARKDHLEGTCVLLTTIDTNGWPRNIRVAQSLREDLDANAIAAVSQYRFAPATQAGKPVAERELIEVKFYLFR